MRKTLTTVSIAAAAITASTGFAVAAQAATGTVTTGACTTGVLGAYCGTQQDGNGLNITATGTPATNQPINASTTSGDQADDFAWFVPAGTFPSGSKQVMVTPSGKLSGYCLSDPDQVYAGHTNAHAIVKRPCSGNNRFQTWTFNGAGWTNAATGLDLTSNGAGKQLTDSAAVSGSATQAWTFQS